METTQKSKSSAQVLTWTLIIGAIVGIVIGIILAPYMSEMVPKITFLSILASGFFGALGLLFIMLIVSLFSNSAWFCHSYGWHRNRDIVFTKNDGATNHGNCKRCCATDLMQDSLWLYNSEQFPPKQC